MAQQTRQPNDIINNAFYMIGEYRTDEPIPGPDVQRGLYLLNQLLDQFASVKLYIPTITQYDFNLVPDQDLYTFSNLISADFNTDRIVGIEYCNIFITPGERQINYPVDIVTRTELLNNRRYLQGRSRPRYVLFENFVQFSQLTFFPTPDKNYSVQLYAKFMLDKLDLNTDITEVPVYFHRFLQYALARELINFFPSANWTPTAEDEYRRMYDDLTAGNQRDMTMKPSLLLRYPYGRFQGRFDEI